MYLVSTSRSLVGKEKRGAAAKGKDEKVERLVAGSEK